MNTKLGQIVRKMGTLSIVFVFLMHSVATAQGNEGSPRPTPVMIDEITKNMQQKMLTFRVNKDGQESIADFQVNPKEILSTTVLQHMLREQEKHINEWIQFVKSYLTDPKIFKQFGLGQNEQDRQTLIRQLGSPQQIDDLYQKLSTRKRQQIGMAYKAKTYDPQSLKKFYARYLGLPENSGQKEINDRLIVIKKHSPQMIDEMIRVYHVNHDGMGKRLYSAVSRPINTQLHGFPTQSALFAVAIGAVMMSKLMTDYAANPAALQQHLDSLDDPLAHIAFYSFMAANGLVGDFLAAKWGGPGMGGVSAQKFRQASIPYIGMTAGMLASNLTHEVGNLMSVCSDRLMGKTPNPAEMANMMGGDQGKDPCDLAQEEFFNFENKVEQYFPMIISMALSTAGSTVAQQVITRYTVGGVAALKSFGEYDKYIQSRAESAAKPIQTMSGASQMKYYSKISAGDLIKASKKVTNASIRMTGLVITARFVPLTGFWFNTLTVGTTVYSIAQNAAFIYLDTVMIPWLSKQWAQVWRAGGVDSAEKKLKLSIEYYEKKGWVLDSRDRGCENAMMNARSPNCPSDILKNLEEFQKQMEAWRMQNHARFFTGIQVWNEITTNLINEVDQAQKFYAFYINEVFKTERIKKREQFLGHEVTDVDANHKQNLTGRPTPLFGIRPLGHVACQPNLAAMATGQQQPKDESCDTELSLYLNHPDKMIGFQRNRVQSVVNTFGELFGMEKRPLPFVEKEENSQFDVFNSKPEEITTKVEAARQDPAQNQRQNTLTNKYEIEKWNEALKAHNLQIKSALATGNKPLAQSLIAVLFKEDGSFNTSIINQHLKPESKAFIKQIMIDFETSNVEKIAKALVKINSELQYPKLRDPVLDVVLSAIRHALGSPTPILVNGGAVPYLYHENNKDNQSYKAVSRTAGRYQFNRHVEYLIYQMLCGPDSGSDKMVTEFGFSEKYPLLPPQFHAPKITTAKNIEVEWNIEYQPKKGPYRTELCDPYAQDPIPFDGLYYSKIYVDGSKTPVSFFELINTTIPSYILGDLTEKTGTRNERITTENIVSRSNESRVGPWWDSSVKNAIKQIFTKLDNRYQALLVDLYLGLQQDEYDVEMWGTDEMGNPSPVNITTTKVKSMKRTEASQSLLQSNIEEMNVYLKILSGLEKNQIAVRHNGGKPLPVMTKKVNLDRSGKSILNEMRNDPVATLASQEKLLGHIQTVIKLLREVKVKTVNGQQRVSVGDQSIPLKKFKAESMAALKEYTEHFDQLGIKEITQVKIQKLAFQGLEKTLQNLTVYLLNIQLANYSMITNFDDYAKDYKNDGQNKAPVKSSSSLPGR